MVKKVLKKRENKNIKKKNLVFLGIFILILIISLTIAFIYIKNNSKESSEEIINPIKENVADNLNGEIKECIENWTCEEWNQCTNGTQERNCNDQNNCEKTKDKPETEKECCSWICSEWSQCLPTNTSFRTCTLPESCIDFVHEKKPETRNNCTYENPCVDEENKKDYEKEGKITDKNGTDWYDICLDDYTLSEVYCGANGDAKWEEYTCEGICDDGECEETDNNETN